VIDKLNIFLRNCDGSAAIEYTVIASAIGLALIPVLPALSAIVETLFGGVAAGF
jgi:Flp pilus assembly pilin Flp